MNLAEFVRSIPHHPKAGMLFRDHTTPFGDARVFQCAIGEWAARYEAQRIDKVIVVEARGFIVGSKVRHHAQGTLQH